MNENRKTDRRGSKRLPIAVAVAAGISAAIVAGMIINNTLPRTSFSLDIIHPPQAASVTIPVGADQPGGSVGFVPRDIRVLLGVNNTVIWVNENSIPERLISEDQTVSGFGKTKSLIEPRGGTFVFTFTEEGTYNYQSEIHPWLTGKVIVQKAEKSTVEVANSISPIFPKVTVLKERVSTVDGAQVTQLATTMKSESIQRTPEGYGETVLRENQAELALSRGTTSGGDKIISATLTNTDTSPIYVASLLITGATDLGVAPVMVHAIDDGYSPEVWGNIQKPAVTEPMLLNPGESVTAYITGKWNIAAIGEPITTFSVGAGYTYDPTVMEYKEGNNWSISITDVHLE